jgi:hypothetical protein
MIVASKPSVLTYFQVSANSLKLAKKYGHGYIIEWLFTRFGEIN